VEKKKEILVGSGPFPREEEILGHARERGFGTYMEKREKLEFDYGMVGE